MMKSSLFAVLITFIPVSAFARETPPLYAPAPTATVAQPADQPTTHGQDDPHAARRGFFMRAEVGGGYRSFSMKQSDLRLTGGGASAAFLVGGNVVPNLILLGELGVNTIVNPDIRVGDAAVETNDVSTSLVSVGPGVLYYVMPANLSLGTSLLFSKASVSRADVKLAETKFGYGATLRAGKEWWLGSRAALGITGQLTFAAMQDEGEKPDTLTATAFNIAASFSY